MLIEIDARGLACPKPVINTKKELDKLENGVIRVTVDNTMAKENIIKLSKSSNCESSVLREEEDLIVVEITKGENVKIEEDTKVDLDNKCIFISSDKMGQGNDELGEVLIKGYIYTLTETKPYPKHIVFVNSGVKLTTVNEATVENLKILENNGVEILSCGTCLDYYNLKESLKVGTVTNMYNIVEVMNNSLQTISI
ncbi:MULTISPECIES: sulfurtransferase-like selenium metabolism protein YedF [unclassified Romboutsia]|uniref:sulfurtransferase-like selenium metabolism protein YedF n=1 Tax=unclassified Romboutsia TaxID=2626894 RepID=UPI0018997E99|nr:MULTISPECIES: sulfurtransferase-like selenium metabolism protein YedF [unclassified Romboutsia]MDB8805739.1 sulfurtransferase-like selenium metabolism protein YedF [Romboutsia sp. 1001216sp1]MDB8808223.1 sulfurtransferase-like selenium metabolism protein YedF [Romboutsia sp. 1001216sp1]MDB8811492.1 sulfurtransferase-like selenium metabolism protein YedF [Romboutsia sp. 1001216sp1]MDB8817249.1 sulfurtransferase-like selenium metabolism protein YedF [Romboutsia sp. 1001216sp1]MDB8819848.1 sul